jgi:hypothetical protein
MQDHYTTEEKKFFRNEELNRLKLKNSYLDMLIRVNTKNIVVNVKSNAVNENIITFLEKESYTTNNYIYQPNFKSVSTLISIVIYQVIVSFIFF